MVSGGILFWSMFLYDLFPGFLRETGEDTVIHTKDSYWMDDKMRLFYANARTLDEQPYPSSVLQTFRRALSMALSSTSPNITVGISQDPKFEVSNTLLAAIMKKEKKRRSPTKPISKADVEQLYVSGALSDENPWSLFQKVWFDIVQHLCRPKMPDSFLDCLVKQSLSLESDANGVYYSFVDMGYVPDCDQLGQMYATPDDPDRCPVRTTSLYLSKLDENSNALFQCPNNQWSPTDPQWYKPVELERQHVRGMMQRISSVANLSRQYSIAELMSTPIQQGQKVEEEREVDLTQDIDKYFSVGKKEPLE